ncbi:MAG: PRC-barrel domain-containing protein [Nitrososphaeria archaeon]
MNISKIYNMDVYTDGGQYLGKIKDAIVDLEKGEISRLLMEEWQKSSKEEVKKVLQQKSVLFKNIKNVGDVVLVSVNPQSKQETPEETADLSLR